MKNNHIFGSIKSILKFLKLKTNIKPQFSIADSQSILRNDDAEAVQVACFNELHYPSDNIYKGFRSYIKMVNLAYHLECTKILEIGAGLSTAVWANFAQKSGAYICSIDLDFGSLKSYIRNTSHSVKVNAHIELVEGATITADDLVNFYNDKPIKLFGGVEASEFAEYLDIFKNMNCSAQRRNEIAEFVSKKKWSIQDLVIDKSYLIMPRPLIDLYSSNKNFDDAVSMLKKAESRKPVGVLDRFSDKGNDWDLIFFDCGELSSIIEWLKFKDNIKPGGLAAFHDIFFPKSFKNFIVCASLLADPGWKTIFIDQSTKQGLMVAQKVKQKD